MQVSIRSSHAHLHHQHHRSPNMFYLFVLFAAAVLGTQTVTFVAIIFLFKELQKYDDRRITHEDKKADNAAAWGTWGDQN